MKTRLILFSSILLGLLVLLSGCSAGKSGLISITPQQYFYSAKEKLEIIDERAFEEKDLDEITRVFENAEKDAKSQDIMDKARLYLTLTNVLKARKQYFSNVLKGQFLANKAEPFFALDVKPVLETLRVAKKWLRMCEASFKTESLLPDLYFVKGLFYQQKMLTQVAGERRYSLWLAVESFRKALGLAPDYKSDFKLFGRNLTPREVRLKLIETLAMSGEVATAWELLSEYVFSPANPRNDYQWLQMKGFLLAVMGKYEDAIKVLNIFKSVLPQDYPNVEEALWVLEGVYDRLKEATGQEKYGVEAKIVASFLKKHKGRYSKEKYTTSSNMYPKWLPGDMDFFTGLIAFIEGDFQKADESLKKIATRGILSKLNRQMGRVIAFENALYGGNKVTDDFVEEIIKIALDRDISPILKERIGYILARYVNDQEKEFKSGKLEGEGQGFVKAIMSKPWVLTLKYQKGKNEPKKEDKSRNNPKGEGEADRQENKDSASLIAEVYANRKEDWITSADLHLFALPSMSLIGKGRIVGREEEKLGWIFKGPEIDVLQKENAYLAVFEFANSDSDKSNCGVIFQPLEYTVMSEQEKRKYLSTGNNNSSNNTNTNSPNTSIPMH
ncbi:MAG: hypothetical protein HQM08_01045 [Candidatus Riflebacteria bacterium]|nr:hypothetical protein [Candidatus Riflebacteria bacterium]